MPNVLALLLATPAGLAAPAAPARKIPAEVLVELRLLENRFEQALAADCAAERCFSRGCVWMEHTVADRPSQGGLPGLGEGALDPDLRPQAWLTRAQCSFAHEPDEQPGATSALVRRLEARLSNGLLVVAVDSQALSPLPPSMRKAPEATGEETPPAPVPEAPATPPPLGAEEVRRATFETLLPHSPWMLGMVLGTLAAMLLLWAWRRVGREEPALEPATATVDPPPAAVQVEPDPEAALAETEARWRARLGSMSPEHPELRALAASLLRAGDTELLARAMLLVPEHLPAALPRGPEHAQARLRLASQLRASTLPPPDAALFAALERHALAAAIGADGEADLARSLAEDFGATGLAHLIAAVPPRTGALLFALAPTELRAATLAPLGAAGAARLVPALLRSDRLSDSEARRLSQVLRAARDEAPLPPLPEPEPIADRGTRFDAPAALETLLSALPEAERRAAFARVVAERGGLAPWHRELVLGAWLLRLPGEDLADLLLAVEPGALAAWLDAQPPDGREALLAAAPSSLRAALRASPPAPSPEARAEAQARGRTALARGLQGLLQRRGWSFDALVLGEADSA